MFSCGRFVFPCFVDLYALCVLDNLKFSFFVLLGVRGVVFACGLFACGLLQNAFIVSVLPKEETSSLEWVLSLCVRLPEDV